MTTTKPANNRAVTLLGANTIFEPLGATIQQHEMGYYWVQYRNEVIQAKTLTLLCQNLVRTLIS
jgi:hypothetical protein